MNYLKKFLTGNKMIHRVSKEIYNNKPMKFDHIAHRTFRGDKVSTEYLLNYSNFNLMNDRFNFKKHNAYAEWFDTSLNDNKYTKELNDSRFVGCPKLFISTYKGVDEDSHLKNSNIDLEHIQWCIDDKERKPTHSLYEMINKKNSYLAWTLLHRNKINHVGLLVDNIEETLEKTSEIFTINNEHNPIQVSSDGNLLQFSTTSEYLPTQFSDGVFEAPAHFIEFVERKNGRNGFSQSNANIVFDSTK